MEHDLTDDRDRADLGEAQEQGSSRTFDHGREQAFLYQGYRDPVGQFLAAPVG
ncbi:MAG: hypothetical protein VX633_04335 [Verrucomicrobiota bacterium]|nr:hypothetical protein [Verrucomicrobiota bacterium]